MPRRLHEMKINPWVPPLALLALAVIIWLTAEMNDGLALVLAGGSAFMALLGAIRSISHGLRPVATAFYVFWFSWLGVGPIMQLSLGQVAWGDTTVLIRNDRLYFALFLTLVAIASFSVGEGLGRARRPPAEYPTLPRARVRPKVLLAAIAMLGLLAPIAIRTVGFGTYFTTRGDRSGAVASSGNSIDEVGGAVYALYDALPVVLSVSVALLGLYHIQLSRAKGARLQAHHIAPMLLGVAAICVFANPLSQTRFVALTSLGSLTLALIQPRSKKAGVAYLTFGLVATLLLYPLANVFRGSSNTSLWEISTSTFTSIDFDGFQQIVNTITYVHDYGYKWGMNLLSALLFFVPRSVWPDKPVSASTEIAANAGYAFTNLSLPIHAELYLQFGIVGVVIGMFGLGFGTARIDSAWLTAPWSKLALFAPYMAVAMFGILRGPLGAQVPIYVPVLILLGLGLQSDRGRAPGGHPGHRPQASAHPPVTEPQPANSAQ